MDPNGKVDIQKIDTLNQLADIMTKGLVQAKFEPLQDKLMGWDLRNETGVPLEANVHSRGSVAGVSNGTSQNVSLVSSVLKALIVALQD